MNQLSVTLLRLGFLVLLWLLVLSSIGVLRADLYGTRNLGLNYGLLFTAWGAAGILGPLIGGRVFDSFGDYRYAFYAASALAIVAFVSLMLVKPLRENVRATEAV